MVSSLLLAGILWLMLTASSETFNGWWGLVLAVAMITVYTLLISNTEANIAWNYIKSNPWKIVGLAIVYVGMGLLWSFYKWYLFIKDAVVRGEKDRSWLKPEYHNDKIITWMMYWPFSLSWYIAHDPITRFYKWLYSFVADTYMKILDKTYSAHEKQ